MADMTKQRLIGTLLVLAVILLVALVLVKNANNSIDETIEISLPQAVSPLKTSESEIIEVEQEALVDPHGLEEQVIAIEDVTTIEQVAILQETSDKSDLTEAPSSNDVNEVIAQTYVTPTVKPTTVAVIKPKAAKIITQKEVVKPAPALKTPPKNKPDIKPVNKAKSTGPQWTIQLASFGVQQNAEALQKKAKILGYEADIIAVKDSKNKTIYRVRIGPEVEQKNVDMIVSKIKQHLQLNPQVIKIQ